MNTLSAASDLLAILIGSACLYVSQFARHHQVPRVTAQSTLAGAAGLFAVASGYLGLRGRADAAQIADTCFRACLLLAIWRFHCWGAALFQLRRRKRAKHDHRTTSAHTI